MPRVLKCDVLRHAWDDVESPWFVKKDWPRCDCFTFRCQRCDRERRDVFDKATGDLVSRRYVAPAGYERYGRNETPTMGEFRLMLLSQRVQAARSGLRRQVLAERKTRRSATVGIRAS